MIRAGAATGRAIRRADAGLVAERQLLRDKIEQWSIPEPNSGCWLWLGATNGEKGYGVVTIARRQRYAHRISFEAHREPIPAGLKVRHRCDTPLCVNPDHLLLGTQKDNIHDAIERGRAGWQRYPAQWKAHGHRLQACGVRACGEKNGRHTRPERTARGEKVHTSKLTAQDVIAIRASPITNNAELARQYGVTATNIRFIRIRQSWRHL